MKVFYTTYVYVPCNQSFGASLPKITSGEFGPKSQLAISPTRHTGQRSFEFTERRIVCLGRAAKGKDNDGHRRSDSILAS